MKVIHCCLAAFYNDGYAYQENILPKMHRQQGHEVRIVASTEAFLDKMNLGYTVPGKYINEDGVQVVRLPYVGFLPLKVAAKLRIYKGLAEQLNEFQPDVIFLHDAQFLSIGEVVRYIKKHPNVRVYADSHTDFGNSARSFVSRYILHGVIYRYCVRRIMGYVRCFYPTLPTRTAFLEEMYKVPSEKISLLVMGADDAQVERVKSQGVRNEIRSRYGVKDSDLLFMTGGKFDERKKDVLLLMEAVRQLPESLNVKLMVFGSVMEGQFKKAFDSLVDGSRVMYVGWVSGEMTYDYIEASDVMVFPGSHSVLWEQAVGQGKICVFNDYMNLRHLDVGGNCLFIDGASMDDIRSALDRVIGSREEMQNVAESKGVDYFSYYKIAERSIAE